MIFHECLQRDSNVSPLCVKGALGCFLKKRLTFVCRSQGSYQCKLNWIETPLVQPLHNQYHIEILLKCPLNTHETRLGLQCQTPTLSKVKEQ